MKKKDLKKFQSFKMEALSNNEKTEMDERNFQLKDWTVNIFDVLHFCWEKSKRNLHILFMKFNSQVFSTTEFSSDWIHSSQYT